MRLPRLSILTTIFLLILATLAVLLILLQPEINVRQGKALVKASTAYFYIPSLQPVKVYAFDPNDQTLNQILQNDTKNVDATFGIYVKNLNTKQISTINPDLQFESASLYKLFVMYTIFNKGAQGKLDVNQPDISQNLNAMITVSSNDAAYYLVNTYTSWDEVNSQMQALGLTGTDLNQNPTITTPADVEKLLELIADGKAVNLDSSVKMLDLMSQQTIRDRIPALLPSSAIIANKTGDLDDVLHDAAVIGTDKSDYIIVLMTKDSSDLNKTKDEMQKISQDVYNYFDNQWDVLPEVL